MTKGAFVYTHLSFEHGLESAHLCMTLIIIAERAQAAFVCNTNQPRTWARVNQSREMGRHISGDFCAKGWRKEEMCKSKLGFV